jgi:hypothetical protein
MVILQFDKGMTSLMKVIALTILLLMLALIGFASALSRKKLRVEVFLMNRLWRTNKWIRKKSGQQSGTLIRTNGTRLRMVRFNVSRSSSVVLTLAMSVSQAAEGEEAFTLVGSVK